MRRIIGKILLLYENSGDNISNLQENMIPNECYNLEQIKCSDCDKYY